MTHRGLEFHGKLVELWNESTGATGATGVCSPTSQRMSPHNDDAQTEREFIQTELASLGLVK